MISRGAGVPLFALSQESASACSGADGCFFACMHSSSVAVDNIRPHLECIRDMGSFIRKKRSHVSARALLARESARSHKVISVASSDGICLFPSW